MKLYTFSITVEIPDDLGSTPAERTSILASMEELCARKSWDLYDSEIIFEED